MSPEIAGFDCLFAGFNLLFFSERFVLYSFAKKMKLIKSVFRRKTFAFAFGTVLLVILLGIFRSNFMHVAWIAKIQGGISPGEVSFWRVISRSVSALSFGVPFTILVWQWSNRNKNWKPLLYYLSSLALAGTINLAAKLTFRGVRPFDFSSEIVKLDSGGSFSFPSGHSAEAFAAAVFITCWINISLLRIVVLVWASLVAFSRVILGVHTPVDVIVGMALGAVVSLIVFQVAKAKGVLQ